MAGAGFKTFSAGQILGASDVNTYLMQQSVMVFNNYAAGTAAIPSPSQGMLMYLKDEARTYQYTGSAWKPNTNFTSESGTASITTSGAINFTSGRFTQTPYIVATVVSGNNTATSVTITTNTTTGFTAYVWTGTSAVGTAKTVHWFAIQATA